MSQERSQKALCLITLLASLHLSGLHAQDFDVIAPKEIQTPIQKVELQTGQLPQLDDNQSIIVPSLNGLVFHSEMEAVSPEAQTGSQRITVPAEASLMQQPAFQKLASAYLDKPVSLASLSELRRDIIVYFRAKNYPVMDVILPEQDISNGWAQLVVIVSSMNEIEVTGNTHFSSAQIAEKVKVPQGEAINVKTLIENVEWLNRNAFIDVQPILSPGQKSYTTDLILRVADRRPWRAYAGYENNGTALTGEDRYFVGGNWGNAFGLMHQLNYQMTSARTMSDFNAHSFSYSIPVQYGHELKFYGGYTTTEAEVGPFTIEGESAEFGLEYSVLLDTESAWSQTIYGGLNWKLSKNALEFSSIPASDSESQIGLVQIGYRASRWFERRYIRLDTSVSLSPGDIFSNSDDAAYDNIRGGASSTYGMLEATFQWREKLSDSLLWESTLVGQWSSARLLPSELLGVGGAYSVRGYNEREFSQVDSGVILRNELQFKPWVHESADSTCSFGSQRLHTYLFSDAAIAKGHGDDILQRDGKFKHTGKMWSAGLGFRIEVDEHLSFRAEYGHQLIEAGSDDDGRLHVGGIISF